jgi:hypothetical protein
MSQFEIKPPSILSKGRNDRRGTLHLKMKAPAGSGAMVKRASSGPQIVTLAGAKHHAMLA